MASIVDAAAADTASSASSATARAERARRNGARSRGPRTEAGKARSSRNALTHGLTAKVHLLQPGEDEPAFQGLATRLFAELAPTGEVDGFLVANLAAAMWRTGRAHQHESLACDGPGGPDERRLGLALRYHGSASRELFRSLRALQELRRRPLAAQPAVDNQPMAAAAADAIPAVAQLAWGGACPPAPPPGCLLMRPVTGRSPADWRWSQHHAYPGAEPVPVDAAGVAYALVDGAWLPQPSPEPAPPTIRTPGSPPPPPRAAEPPPEPCAANPPPELRPSELRPAEPDSPTPWPNAPGPASERLTTFGPSRHDLPVEDPAPPLPDSGRDDDPQRRNEPRMPAPAPAGSGDAAAAADDPAGIPPTGDPSRWYVMWGLTPPDAPPADTARPPITLPDQPAPWHGSGTQDSEPPPPPEAAITASDGGPSWLTRPRAGWQIRAATPPASPELAPGSTETIADPGPRRGSA